MFTLEAIKAAHANVRSGADFPAYIHDLKALGVSNYDTYVTDGHTDYSGTDGHAVSSDGKYPSLAVADVANTQQFIADLKTHQQGGTDYMTFCRDCAHAGVEKWTVSTALMTCTYYDRAGNQLLEEVIPG
jgi:uncharacterized protein YbcV (DUF1398 family)